MSNKTQLVTTTLRLCALIAIGVSLPELSAQEKAGSRDEVQAIFRISKQFLDEETEKEIFATIPTTARVVGFQCTSLIRAVGIPSMELLSHPGQAIFRINAQGSAQSGVTGQRGLIVAHGFAWGTFTSQTYVQFDGRKVMLIETTPCAQVHGQLERVTSRRDGPLGRSIGRLAMPIGNRMIPRAEWQATPIAEQVLKDFVNQKGEKLITVLNHKMPVEDSINRLYPETKNWGFQLSADADFLQAAYGPPGAQVPALPKIPNRIDNVRVEAWLHSSGPEAKFLENLSKQPLAKQVVLKYLKSTLPKLAAIAEDYSVTAIGSWVVISVGSQKPK